MIFVLSFHGFAGAFYEPFYLFPYFLLYKCKRDDTFSKNVVPHFLYQNLKI